MSEAYIVEKKVNVRAVLLIIAGILAFVIATVVGFSVIIREYRLNTLRKYIRHKEYNDARYAFRENYERMPLDKRILKEGIHLYYQMMLHSKDSTTVTDAAEHVVRYIRQLMLVDFFVERDATYYYRLGKAFHVKGQGFYIDSLQALRRAVYLGNDSLETVALMALVAHKIGWHDEAVTYFEQCLRAEREGKKAFAMTEEMKYTLAQSYEGSGQYTKGIAFLKEFAPTVTNRMLAFTVYQTLGRLSLRQRLFADGEFFYKKAIEINEKSADTFYQLGLLYKAWGKRNLAYRHFVRARYLFQQEGKKHEEAIREIRNL